MAASRTAKRLRWALVLTGVAAVVLVSLTGYQAFKAKDALALVADDFETLSGQLTSGDRAGALVTLQAAQEHAASAQKNTQGPGWWLTSQMPGVGKNVVAVRTVTDVVDALATGVLPPVVDASATLRPENLRPRNGRIALQPIVDVAPKVVEANDRMQVEVAKLAELKPRRLAREIGTSVRMIQRTLGEAAQLSDRAARAVQLLPPMLGADGPRTYLLLFQNNAEVRATGGIPGSFATVTAEDGRIELGRQGDASTIGRFDEPPIPLTADELALFGENLGLFPQDVNFTPDFPRSAQLAAAMWNARHGVKVDGVLSTDPVALSYLLRGTGPVPVGDGRSLTAGNAVRLLLSDVYADVPDPTRQNVFFSTVAATVFAALADGQGEPRAVLEGLVHGAEERRLLMWSSKPDEQALLVGTKLGGVLSTEPEPHPHVSVFLNDGTGAKMDYYLDYEASVTSTGCDEGRQRLQVELSLRSTAPRDVDSLPDYVTGVAAGQDTSVSGVPRGTIRTSIYLYSPVDGYVDGSELDGQPFELSPAEHDGRKLVRTTLDVKPGERRTLTVQMVSGPDQTLDPVLRITPGARGSGVGDVSATSCS